MKIKVSVIIPVYNTEKYIKKCLESVLNQSLQEIEIIVINDGSTDKSKEIIEGFAKNDNRIVLINKENEGQSVARNVGINLAKGEYIGFLDSDDWIENDMFKVMYTEAKKFDLDIVICNRNIINELNGNILKNDLKIKNDMVDLNNYGRDKYIYDYILSYRTANEVWNKIFRKKMIEDNEIKFWSNSIKGFPEIAEDALFNLTSALYANKVIEIQEGYYNYVHRKGSSVNSYKPYLLKRIINMIKIFSIELEKSRTMENNKKEKLIQTLLLARIVNCYAIYVREERKNEFINEWKEEREDEFVKNNLNLNVKDKKNNFYILILKNNLFFVFDILQKRKNLKKMIRNHRLKNRM